ncbi:unnamed protein product, partial [Ectocarpus sp. 8 AP-2014]
MNGQTSASASCCRPQRIEPPQHSRRAEQTIPVTLHLADPAQRSKVQSKGLPYRTGANYQLLSTSPYRTPQTTNPEFRKHEGQPPCSGFNSHTRRLLENAVVSVPKESGGKVETNVGAIRPFFLDRRLGRAVGATAAAVAAAAAPSPPASESQPNPPSPLLTAPPSLFRRLPLRVSELMLSLPPPSLQSTASDADRTVPEAVGVHSAAVAAAAGALTGAPAAAATPAAEVLDPFPIAAAAAASSTPAPSPFPAGLSLSSTGDTPFVMLRPSRIRVGRDRASPAARGPGLVALAAAGPAEPRLEVNAAQKLAQLDCFSSRWAIPSRGAADEHGGVASGTTLSPRPTPQSSPEATGPATEAAATVAGAWVGVVAATLPPREGSALGSASQRVTGPSPAVCSPTPSSAAPSHKQLGTE